MSFKLIATYDNFMLANKAMALMTQHEIKCQLKDELVDTDFYSGEAIGSFKFLVEEKDYNKAVLLLNNAKSIFMNEELLTFQRVKDPEIAKDLEEKFSEAGIYFQTESEDKFFDASFSASTVKNNINIKIKPSDFVKANKVLDDYYESQIEQVSPDYYLFDFADDELKEILEKSDEWGHLDYQLAQAILKDRGHEVNLETLESFKERRKHELSKPEKSQHWLAIFGYFAASLSPFLNDLPRLTGFFIAIFIGWILSNAKKTLPDGDTVQVYGPSDRLQGKILMVAGTILLVGFFIYSQYQSGAFI